jgi:hypothetical protein
MPCPLLYADGEVKDDKKGYLDLDGLTMHGSSRRRLSTAGRNDTKPQSLAADSV